MKKLSVGVIGLLVIIIFIFEIYYNNEYNAKVKEVYTSYKALYSSLEEVMHGNNIDYEVLSASYELYHSTFYDWYKEYRQRFDVYVVPRNKKVGTMSWGDAHKQLIELRNLYYDTVEIVYQKKEKIDLSMYDQLQKADREIEKIFSEIELFP